MTESTPKSQAPSPVTVVATVPATASAGAAHNDNAQLNAYLATDEGKQWAKRTLSAAFQRLQEEQARQAQLKARAEAMGLDPKFKELYDVALIHGCTLSPKTYQDGQTLYRLVPGNNVSLIQRIEAADQARAYGINVHELAMADGVRMVASVRDVMALNLALRYSTDFKTRVVTLPESMPDNPVLPRIGSPS